MFAVIEVRHADIGPLFERREDAEAALREIRHNVPWTADDYEVVELTTDGFPIGPSVQAQAPARRFGQVSR